MHRHPLFRRLRRVAPAGAFDLQQPGTAAANSASGSAFAVDVHQDPLEAGGASSSATTGQGRDASTAVVTDPTTT
ncbi:hypothetical protein [Burkholderia sp. Cy-637]|uniref:hypothetical protein n=1 Tax=Burkholderia sp. Cy-637 TaxID=2608327 RepID=UPI0014218BA4|nr:hypothetical protein [Burkholderia sp. Cy-637]NIF88606.1 hypothetical protein [Burkholderia sp. Cy-637]